MKRFGDPPLRSGFLCQFFKFFGGLVGHEDNRNISKFPGRFEQAHFAVAPQQWEFDVDEKKVGTVAREDVGVGFDPPIRP